VDTASAEGAFREFIGDAACVLQVNEELHEAAPALIEEPFNPDAQRRLLELLSSDRQHRANEAFVRIAQARPVGDL